MRRLTVLGALALAVASCALPARAQELQWERVGRQNLEMLHTPEWLPDGRLWGSTNSLSLWSLESPYDSLGTWQSFSTMVAGSVTALGLDTVIVRSHVRLYRTTDGGTTFVQTGQSSSGTLGYETVVVPYGVPHGGTVFVPGRASYGGEGYGAYSRDRGATWTPASISVPHPEHYPSVYGNTVVPRGPRAGRLVNGGTWGLAVSDDGGATFAPVPGWWVQYRYLVTAVGVVAGAAPDGGDRLVAALNDAQDPVYGAQVLLSDDGGDTWRRTVHLTGDPNAWGVAVVDLGGGEALVAMNGGHVWRSSDGAETWALAGIVEGSAVDPATVRHGAVLWARLGPDRRLYVGGQRLGPGPEGEPGWLLRTALPLAVASGEAPPAASDVALTVRPNPSSGEATVTVSGAAGAQVHVSVVDVLGRTVRVLFDGVRPGPLPVTRLPAGVYVVRAVVRHPGGQTETAGRALTVGP